MLLEQLSEKRVSTHYVMSAYITTDDIELYKKIKIFRNYGSEKRYFNCVVGTNSRLDELQAGLLRVRLKHLDDLNEERKFLCQNYLDYINNKRILLPDVLENATTVWHQFVIRCNDKEELISYLYEKGIGSIIHYPILQHSSEVYRYLNTPEDELRITDRYADAVLSLPLYNGMTSEEQEEVIRVLNEF